MKVALHVNRHVRASTDPTEYPLFIAVHESDRDGAIQVVLEPRSQIDAEMVDGRSATPLQEAVAFATEHYAPFESALDMLGRMYDDVDGTADDP